MNPSSCTRGHHLRKASSCIVGSELMSQMGLHNDTAVIVTSATRVVGVVSGWRMAGHVV